MIQLHPESLLFKISTGEVIPCSAEQVTVEFIADSTSPLDPELIRNAARAVLHYFKVELGKCQVSVGEFSEALVRVLRGFGLDVAEGDSEPIPGRVAEMDLRQLAQRSGKGFELAFFTDLRRELRRQLTGTPRTVRFNGLRGCVKQLSGAQRWCRRCQSLNDQIVEFLRQCLACDSKHESCSLVVQ